MDGWKWNAREFSLDRSRDEVFVASVDSVGLYDGSQKTEWRDSKLLLTSHRLILQPKYEMKREQDKGTMAFLELDLEVIQKSGVTPVIQKGSIFSSGKVVIHLTGGKFVQLAFRSGGMSNFFTHLIRVLQRKAWQCAEKNSNLIQNVPVTSSGVPQATTGISAKNLHHTALSSPVKHIGIARVMEVAVGSVRIQETFKDIDEVMSKASSLVQRIKKLKERSVVDSNGFQTGPNEENMMAIESIEATLGLGTMVQTNTKYMKLHGKQPQHFHEELARELHAWMIHPNNESLFGGMPLLPLIELFSVYNKARSGDLVSPEDVLIACKIIHKWGSGSFYRLETLPSGCMAFVHKDPFIILARISEIIGPMLISHKKEQNNDSNALPESSTAHMLNKLKTIATFPRTIAELRPINEVQLASSLQISPTVAQDILYKFTVQGYLCLCEHSFGCTTYYWNIFAF